MRKKIIIGFVVAAIAAVPAFASLIEIWNTTGLGMAAGSNNTTGVKFRISASRTSHQGTMTISGDLYLASANAGGGGLSEVILPDGNTLPSPTPRPSVPPGASPTPRPSPSPHPTMPPRHGTVLSMQVTGYEPGATTNAVQLSGPATLRVASTTGVQTYPGTATANLVSNRHPDEDGNPDTLEVQFVPTDAGPNFTFSGTVTAGDIRISQTDSY
jgi:hypothetical protein